MHHRFTSVFRLVFLIVLLAGMTLQPQFEAHAAASLSVTPITWNVIGLDSNNVNVGPNHFPVGARVCNTGDAAATNVKSSFIWDSNDPYINLRTGTLTAYTDNGIDLNPDECIDFYYEVEVTRTSAAYKHTRRYHITASADGGLTGSTLIPRELFVEYLVSQNRNAVSDVKLNGVSIPNGGTMSLVVGNTYTIQLVGSTATQGYEQIESFINFPNTIFQVLSVITTYTAETSAGMLPPYDSLYGDACGWENNPNSPNYRACTGVGKAGGNITVTYQIKILQAPAAPLVNPSPLSTLIYDFSGSSYHYNADFGVSTRYAYVLDPSAITISKNFNPDPTTVSGISSLTFTLTNSTSVTITGLNFTDSLPTTPGAMTVASTPNASTTGCGSPTFAPLAGATSLSFTNGTLAPNSSCTIKVNVTVPVAGTYNNTSSHLFIDALDTGNNANDSLVVNTAPAGPAPVCGLTMAQWTFAGFTTNPPPFPAASTKAANVATAAISVGNGLTAESDTTASGGNPQPGIRTYGWQNAAPINTGTSAFMQFAIDTSKYTQVAMQFDAQRKANGPSSDELHYSTDGTNWSPKSTFSSSTSWATYGPYTFTGQTSTTGITYFRIYGYGANATSSGNDMNLDNVTFSGCGAPSSLTIGKAFSPNPVAVGATSTLTFTLTNPNSAVALSGISFTDSLPSDLTVPNGSSTQCGGTLSTTAPQTISFSGGSLGINASCTINVTVTTTASGVYDNVSGFVSSTEGGTNTSPTGIATASLTVLKPPSIAKLFAPNPILVNGTSTLTFTITNPNLNNALTGIAFSDTYPGGVVNTNPASSTNSCGGTVTAVAGVNNVSLNGGTVAAGGTCVLTVKVTASSVGPYTNTSGAVSSTNGGIGNTASDILTVNSPNPAIAMLKQVSTSASGPWSNYITVNVGTNVYYQYTVENIGEVPFSQVSVTDPLVNTAGCTWPVSLPVAVSGNDNHIARCVVGPVVAVTGSNVNTATASGTYSGIPYTSTSSSATYSTPGLTLVKSVTETSFTAAGDLLHYSYLVTNSGFAPLLGPVTVTDDKAVVTCPDLSITGDLDNYFDPGEAVTCTATYTVVPADVTAGFVTNIASASVSGVTSNSDTKTVNIFRPDLTVAKTNNVSGSVAQNGTFNWTINVSNSGIAAAAFADTNLIMNDALPGVDANYQQGPLTVTDGAPSPTGTINCSITGTALVCVANGAVTLPVGSSFSVTVVVTPTTVGSLANTATVDPNGNVLESNEANNTGLDTVMIVAPPSIEKQFTPETVAVGGTSTLMFQIFNINTGTNLTGVAFTDSLPAGLQIASPPNGSTSGCGAPTFAPIAADTTLTFSGGTISALNSCILSVDVIATTTGVKNNTTGNVSSTNGGTGNTASYTLTVYVPSIVLTTTPMLNDAVVAPSGVVNAGDTITYSFSVENTGTVTITSIVVTDPLLPSLTCTIASLASAATASCTATNNIYTLTQADINAGSRANTATATGKDPGNNDVTDLDTKSVTLTPVPSIVLTKTATLDDTIVAPNGVINVGDTITYTFSVENTGNVTITNINVTDPLLPSLTCTIASLAPGATVNCSAGNNVYTLTQADVDMGSRANTATATGKDPGNNDVADTDTRNTTLTQAPSLNIVKEVSTDNSTWDNTSVIVTIGDSVYYRVRVANTGNTTLTGLTVDDGMAGCVLVRSADITGNNDNVFEVGEEWGYSCSVTAVAGTNNNTATADSNETSQDSDSASYIASAAFVADPALSKAGSPTQASVGETVTFTLTVTNGGNAPASNVVITDALPAMFDVTAVNVSGASLGTLVSVTPPIGTGTAPYTVVVTLGGDLAITDVITINIVTTVNGLGDPPINNTASLTTTSVTDVSSNNSDAIAITIQNSGRAARRSILPATGFAPNVETTLLPQPQDLKFAATDLVLEVPSLSVKIPIVGVPKKDGTWNVSWLGSQAGWLEGSAFPSWNGNSVLTSHVYLANGLPGPFVNLNKLKFGDKIVVHAYGQKYTFEVQTSTVVEPSDRSVMKHEEKPWLTLVTCKDYDEKTDTYKQRLVVRAVLVSVAWE
jgi:LPXTG-site transpeptidase (sortase) family protein